MRKISVILLLVIMTTSLFATKSKVAVLGFKKGDRRSSNVIKSIMKRDLKSVFEDSENFELIPISDVEDKMDDLGYKSLDVVGSQEVAKIATELNADIVVWGDVTSISRTQFDLQAKIFIKRSKNIEFATFQITNKTSKRQNAIKTELLGKIKKFAGGELKKQLSIALQYFQAQNYQFSEEAFLKIIAMDPQHIDSYFYLGYIQFVKGNYPKSEYYYKKGLEVDPGNIKLLDYLSSTYKKQEKHELAIDALKKIAETKNDSTIWLRIGNLYSDMEYYDEAKDAIEKALAINPDYKKATYSLANIYYNEEDFEEALPYLEKTSTMFPDDEEVAKKLAITYKKTGKLESAITHLKGVIASKPEDVKAHLNLASAYLASSSGARDNNKFVQALTYANDAVCILTKLKGFYNENPSVYYKLSNAYRFAANEAKLQKKNKKAKEYNQKAVDILLELKDKDATNLDVYKHLADVYLTINNLTKAEKYANEAIAVDNSKHQPYMILYQIYQKRGFKKYNEFVDIEQKTQSGKVYGKDLDKLIEKRDATKVESNKLFKKCKEYLLKATKKADSNSTISEIKSKMKTIKDLIKETEKSFFE